MATSEKENIQFDKLVERHRHLLKLKIQNETEKSRSEKDLQALRNEIKEKYGVDSIDALRELYLRKLEDNKKKMADFESSITDIEEKLRSASGS